MRVFFLLLFLLFFLIIVSKLVSLLMQGELFKEGAFKESMQQSGKTIWSGMKLFVIVWFLYLIFIWFVRNR